VRRRDHWIRPLELVVGSLYWWHPVAWWARRELRTAEEAACDALVLRTFPGRARAYAEALLKTLEFVSRPARSIPATAMGAAHATRLKERMTMILDESPLPGVSTRARWTLGALALATLLVSPAWIAESAVRGEAAGPHPEDDRARRETQEFERQVLALERQIYDVHARKMNRSLELEEAALRRELDAMRDDIETLRSAGRIEELASRQRELHAAELRAALRRERAEFEQKHAAREAMLAFELRELELRAGEGRPAGTRAEDLARRERELEAKARALRLEAMKRELEWSNRELELEAGE
jgi:hypothetical protein